MKVWGREPALWLGLVAASVKMVAAFWIHLNVEQQAVLNAAAAALLGLIVAFMVRDGIQAGVLGLAQSVLALGVGFGLDVSAENQAVLMSFVGMAAAMFVRTQASAPVPVQDGSVLDGETVG